MVHIYILVNLYQQGGITRYFHIDSFFQYMYKELMVELSPNKLHEKLGGPSAATGKQNESDGVLLIYSFERLEKHVVDLNLYPLVEE